jgi:excisionase family DNA binding protein
MSDALQVILSEQQLNALAERIAAKLAVRERGEGDPWLSTQTAASYLGIHRDTLRRLAGAGKIPCVQEAAGCKLYFRQSDLDCWRANGDQRAA